MSHYKVAAAMRLINENAFLDLSLLPAEMLIVRISKINSLNISDYVFFKEVVEELIIETVKSETCSSVKLGNRYFTDIDNWRKKGQYNVTKIALALQRGINIALTSEERLNLKHYIYINMKRDDPFLYLLVSNKWTDQYLNKTIISNVVEKFCCNYHFLSAKQKFILNWIRYYESLKSYIYKCFILSDIFKTIFIEWNEFRKMSFKIHPRRKDPFICIYFEIEISTNYSIMIEDACKTNFYLGETKKIINRTVL